MAKGDIVAIQRGTGEPEIYKDWSVDQTINAVGKLDDRIAASLKATEQRLDAIQKEITGDPDMTVEYYLLQRAQSQADDLLSCDLAGFSADDQRKRVDQYHRFSTLGSALLYRHSNFGGATKFFTVTWPNFKWWPYKFNDTASSARAWGGNILFEHTWYRGRRLYLIGIPYVQFGNLGDFEFNDIASSFASIG